MLDTTTRNGRWLLSLGTLRLLIAVGARLEVILAPGQRDAQEISRRQDNAVPRVHSRRTGITLELSSRAVSVGVRLHSRGKYQLFDGLVSRNEASPRCIPSTEMGENQHL